MVLRRGGRWLCCAVSDASELAEPLRYVAPLCDVWARNGPWRAPVRFRQFRYREATGNSRRQARAKSLGSGQSMRGDDDEL
jgi:hypothetical protein